MALYLVEDCRKCDQRFTLTTDGGRSWENEENHLDWYETYIQSGHYHTIKELCEWFAEDCHPF